MVRTRSMFIIRIFLRCGYSISKYITACLGFKWFFNSYCPRSYELCLEKDLLDKVVLGGLALGISVIAIMVISSVWIAVLVAK